MTMLIDTHTHLYLPEFEPTGSAAVDRAVEAGVGRMIFPNVDVAGIAPMRELAAQYPGRVFMAMGLHPTEVGERYRDDLDAVLAELRRNRDDYCAVGEIGIDLYWDTTFRTEQMDVFNRQCRAALEMDMPIIIHCRDGLAEVLEVLRQLPQTPRGVFHSFGGSGDDVDAIRDVGDFYFGINGIVTFKNSNLREVLPTIGLDRILLETDSPYLAPVPHRGRRNESAYLTHIATCVADTLGVSVNEVADVTTSSAVRLFGLTVSN